MHPHDFIRKNIISTLLAEGVAAEDARGGGGRGCVVLLPPLLSGKP
ncbi:MULTISPECIES: hypothetical protein [unclassified Pantoea]|nr:MULTISPECIES: hypothetical protein [unclassified Pantoea]